MPDVDADIAIVGAGPAGLALAIGLHAAARSLKVQVYERSAALVPMGAAVTLFANGLDALEAIHPTAVQACAALGIEGKSMATRSHATGELLSAKPSALQLSPEAPPLRSPIFITWFKLQCALLSVLPEGGRQHVVLGKALAALEQDTAGATLHFKDGTSARARVVVGADGNMSAVRSALFDGETPQFIGTAFWRALIKPLPACWDLSREHQGPGWLHNWTSPETGKLMMVRVFDGEMSVSAASAWPEARLPELWRSTYYGSDGGSNKAHHESKRKRFMDVFGGEFCPSATSLLSEVDPVSVVEHGVFWRDPERPWGKGCVTLVGDSAHVMPPNFGQGTSMAFEGAHCLATHIRDAVAAAAAAAGPEYDAGLQRELCAALRRSMSRG